VDTISHTEAEQGEEPPPPYDPRAFEAPRARTPQNLHTGLFAALVDVAFHTLDAKNAAILIAFYRRTNIRTGDTYTTPPNVAAVLGMSPSPLYPRLTFLQSRGYLEVTKLGGGNNCPTHRRVCIPGLERSAWAPRATHAFWYIFNNIVDRAFREVGVREGLLLLAMLRHQSKQAIIEMDIDELARIMGVTESAVNKQIRNLKRAGWLATTANAARWTGKKNVAGPGRGRVAQREIQVPPPLQQSSEPAFQQPQSAVA
jgi:hypothetical protein